MAIAGLTAAHDLVRRGYGVLVIEARDRLGGRTWWERFANTDHCAEMGGTWFDEGPNSYRPGDEALLATYCSEPGGAGVPRVAGRS